jgi:hypothetical protein
VFFLALLPFIAGFLFCGYCVYLATGAAGVLIYVLLIIWLVVWFAQYIREDIEPKK